MDILDFQPREFVADGDRVLVIGWERAKVKATNRTFELDWVMAFTVRNGKVVSFREYTDTKAMADAYESAAAPPDKPGKSRPDSVLALRNELPRRAKRIVSVFGERDFVGDIPADDKIRDPRDPHQIHDLVAEKQAEIRFWAQTRRQNAARLLLVQNERAE